MTFQCDEVSYNPKHKGDIVLQADKVGSAKSRMERCTRLKVVKNLETGLNPCVAMDGRDRAIMCYSDTFPFAPTSSRI